LPPMKCECKLYFAALLLGVPFWPSTEIPIFGGGSEEGVGRSSLDF
jgi:hypothetical protein